MRRAPLSSCQIILLIPFIPCIYALEKYEESDRHRRRIDQSRIDPPKPKRRKRALTVSREERSLFSRKRKTTVQHSSSLMNLPAEVRALIWGEYMGFEDDLYLLFGSGCLSSIRVGQSKREEGARQTTVEISQGIIIPHQQEKKVDILSLLKTCRAIYSEVIPLMYCHTTFAFYDMHSFFAFSASILPHRLHSIRHLNLNFRALHSVTMKDYNDPCSELIPKAIDEYMMPVILINNPLNFTFIHRSHVQVQNLLPGFKLADHPTNWDAACRILGAMKGLRRLELVIDKSRFFLAGGDAEPIIFWPLQKTLYGRIEASIEWTPDSTEPIRGKWVDGRLEWRTVKGDKAVEGRVVFNDTQMTW